MILNVNICDGNFYKITNHWFNYVHQDTGYHGHYKNSFYLVYYWIS